MFTDFQQGLLFILKTLGQIMTAEVSITAFSLLLFALSFNLRNRVARTFALVMSCVVIVFTSEAIGSISSTPERVEFWLRLQWVGIIMLPAVYLHFSDNLLATTGKPSRGRRKTVVVLVYLVSFAFLLSLPLDGFVGPVLMDDPPAPHLEPTDLTRIFSVFYLLIMALTWFNLVRAYNRTTTPTSRRRMSYLITGAMAPALGSFQYLLFGSSLVANHLNLFWVLIILSNTFVAGLLIVMGYAVSFFGVSWPDRVIRRRLFKWLMRGPFTASAALAVSTLTGRIVGSFYPEYTELIPISMVGTIILSEYFITLFSPMGEKILNVGRDQTDVSALKKLEDRLLTRSDLRQFLETVLGAVCDQLQVPGAYVAEFDANGADLIVKVGKSNFENIGVSQHLSKFVNDQEDPPQWFKWGEDYLIPLLNSEDNEDQKKLLGLMGISGVGDRDFEEDQIESLRYLADRVRQVLLDRRAQEKIFQSLETLAPEMDRMQRIRAAGGYSGSDLRSNEEKMTNENMTQWVKDALTHYWGGPKLTDSPLMKLQVVKQSLDLHNGSQANALRAILRKAIENVRPEGERRFTGEWVLYNILEMKFLEGRKVREVATRLAVSEADLYRKQRIAIEVVANSIMEMELKVQNHQIET